MKTDNLELHTYRSSTHFCLDYPLIGVDSVHGSVHSMHGRASGRCRPLNCHPEAVDGAATTLWGALRLAVCCGYRSGRCRDATGYTGGLARRPASVAFESCTVPATAACLPACLPPAPPPDSMASSYVEDAERDGHDIETHTFIKNYVDDGVTHFTMKYARCDR